MAGKLDVKGATVKRKALVFLLLLALSHFTAWAHVGSPNVFFQGKAGPYPVHVVIRPAEVIPGLAEISVRVESGEVQRVTALPIKWNTGHKGAPPPDVAKLVPGETNLYHAQLWFMEGGMERGGQSVELEVAGSTGAGRVTIPVDAVARRVMTMPKNLGAILAACGVLLLALLLAIVGASVRESVLEPGLTPTARRRFGARIAVVVAMIVLTLLVWGGKHWWNAEAENYRNNRLYQPLSASATVRVENAARILRLEIDDLRFAGAAPLVPDHGKLMHLFLIREPALDAFAHLHPVKQNRKTFESVLLKLPPGSYRLYADVTYETGFSDTVTTSVQIPDEPANGGGGSGSPSPDEDDSLRVAPAFAISSATRECRLAPDLAMTWLAPERVVQNQPIQLRFAVSDANRRSVSLEPYLGMRGHLALRKDDGSVFTHLHPGGTASMAAMQLSTLRTEGKLPLKAAFRAEEPICELPALGPGEQEWLRGNASNDPATVTFPYAFPQAGAYRLWVQVKVGGKILTGVFDVDVKSGGDAPIAFAR